MTLTITWHYPTRPSFISAWDAARNHTGHAAFDALSRDEADQDNTRLRQPLIHTLGGLK